MPKDINILQALKAMTNELAHYSPDLNKNRSPVLSILGTLDPLEHETQAARLASGQRMAPMASKALQSYLDDNMMGVPLDFVELAPNIHQQLKKISVGVHSLSDDVLSEHTLNKQRGFLESLQDVCKWSGFIDEEHDKGNRSPFAL